MKKYICTHCGSDDILFDAQAKWNPVKQAFELHQTDPTNAFCVSCDGDCNTEEVKHYPPFIWRGTHITDPTTDETGRFPVDPDQYYLEAEREYIEEEKTPETPKPILVIKLSGGIIQNYSASTPIEIYKVDEDVINEGLSDGFTFFEYFYTPESENAIQLFSGNVEEEIDREFFTYDEADRLIIEQKVIDLMTDNDLIKLKKKFKHEEFEPETEDLIESRLNEYYRKEQEKSDYEEKLHASGKAWMELEGLTGSMDELNLDELTQDQKMIVKYYLKKFEEL